MEKEKILEEVEKHYSKGSQPWGMIKHLLYYKKVSIRQLCEAPFYYNAPNKIKQIVMNYFEQNKDFGLRLMEQWQTNPITNRRFKEFFLQEV